MDSSKREIQVSVWGENRHEQKNEAVREIYPDGMHEAIAGAIREQLGAAVTVRTATLDQPENGLSAPMLAQTDVLTWWAHLAHTRCTLRWREGDDREVVWTVAPAHPIARGVTPGFVSEGALELL